MSLNLDSLVSYRQRTARHHRQLLLRLDHHDIWCSSRFHFRSTVIYYLHQWHWKQPHILNQALCWWLCPLREINTIHNAKCLQRDLSYMFVWSHTWQLNFNVSKCKVMCITNKKSPLTYTYCLNNTPLEWTSTFKYLGVTMNQKLTWHQHTNNITAKNTQPPQT